MDSAWIGMLAWGGKHAGGTHQNIGVNTGHFMVSDVYAACVWTAKEVFAVFVGSMDAALP